MAQNEFKPAKPWLVNYVSDMGIVQNTRNITNSVDTDPSRILCFLTNLLLHSKKKKHLFIWLCQVLVAAWELLSYSIWDLWIISLPGIEPRPLALGASSLSHCTIREIQILHFLRWVLLQLLMSPSPSFNLSISFNAGHFSIMHFNYLYSNTGGT